MMKIKSAAVKCILTLLIMGVLLPTTSTLVAADTPTITVDVDHAAADTWSSVMVQISASAFEGEDNTTYHVSRAIWVILTDLDRPEELARNENVSMVSGIAVYNFIILPEWGEFLLAIDIFDPYTGIEERQTVVVYYSIEYVIYLLSLETDEDIESIREDSEAGDIYQRNMTIFMFLLVFILLPVALLRLDHTRARREGRSSFWDRLQDRIFNWTIVTPVLHHYLEDRAYEFNASGRRQYKATRLRDAMASVDVDMVLLGKVKNKLAKDIAELEGFEEPADERKLAAALVAKSIAFEIDEEAMAEADHEERLAGEEENE